MAFFRLIIKANKIENAKNIYHDEKLHSIEMSKGIKSYYSLSQKIRMKKLIFKKKFIEILKKLTHWNEDSWCYRRITLLKTEGTFDNFLLKSIMGFLSGILLTYMLFLFFTFHLHLTLFSATTWSSIFGVILTMGLAFSYRIRCIVFLILPQFFSKRGRQVLMAYAFILTLTGPTKNTLYNVEVLSESLTCGQEALQETMHNVLDLIKKPFYAFRDFIEKIVKNMKEIVKKVETTLLVIKRLVLSILRVIKSMFEWLGNIVSVCNKKMGTPFERCEKVFDDAVTDCHALLGPYFGGICNLTYLVGAMCYLVKPLDFICILVVFASDLIVNTIKKKIKKFSNHMKTMLYVKIEFSHSFHFQTNKSKSYTDVGNSIAKDIKAKANQFQTIFDLMSLIMSLFIFFMLLLALRYHHKWLTSDRFDNKYLTNYFRHIDIMRAKTNKETVLPLNRRERKKYIPLTSCTLIAVERNKLLRSAVFLILSTFNLCIHIAVDYSLFWILDLIRFHGRFQTKVQQSNSVGVYISGTGYLAELYRSIIHTFSPENFNNEMDTLPCLPQPLPPDYDRYTQIALLIIFSWIMAIFEPYGLRLRQVVMNRYYPDRAKQRAVYLYNQIIRSRGNFLKFARRQLRRKFGMTDNENIEPVTCKERLFAIFPKLNICFPQKNRICLLCGAVEREEQSQHIKCPNPGCVGLFCIECFADLQNICTICKSPMEYGDMSDISEEKDSSGDDASEILKKKLENVDSEQKEKNLKKPRDDVTTQIFNVSLRGGADDIMDNFTQNNYEMQFFSFHSSPSSITPSSKESHASRKNRRMKYGKILKIFRMPLETSDSELSESSQIQNQHLLKTKVLRKRRPHNFKKSKLFKHKYTSRGQQLISSSSSTEFQSPLETRNIYHGSNSNCTSDYFEDDCELGKISKQRYFHVQSQLLSDSTRCYEMNERNRIEHLFNIDQHRQIILTSSDSSEAINTHRKLRSNSKKEFLSKKNNDSPFKSSKLSNLSIGINTESSSEKERRQEILKWYANRSDEDQS